MIDPLLVVVAAGLATLLALLFVGLVFLGLFFWAVAVGDDIHADDEDDEDDEEDPWEWKVFKLK